MSQKACIGKVTAYIPGQDGEKGRGKHIGWAYQDNTNGRISFVIDTLPIPTSGWKGWCNIIRFEDMKKKEDNGNQSQTSFDDDIPF